MKNRLNINSDCSNISYLPNIKIVLPFRKDYFSKPKINVDEDRESYFKRIKDRLDNSFYGEFEIELTPEDYIIDGKKISKIQKENSQQKTLTDNFSSLLEREVECHPAFMAIDVPPPRGPLFVFGEYFLRKFYTVFDRDRLLIGLAESKETNEENDEKIVTPYDLSDDKVNSNSKSNSESKKTGNLRTGSEKMLTDVLKTNSQEDNNEDHLILDDEVELESNKINKGNSGVNSNLKTNEDENESKESNNTNNSAGKINLNNPNNDSNSSLTSSVELNKKLNTINNNQDYNQIVKENDSKENTSYEDFMKMSTVSFLDKELSLDLI